MITTWSEWGKKQDDPVALHQEEDNADKFGDKVANEPGSMSIKDATAAVTKAFEQDQSANQPAQQRDPKKEPK